MVSSFQSWVVLGDSTLCSPNRVCDVYCSVIYQRPNQIYIEPVVATLVLARTSGSLFETADKTWHRCDSDAVGVSSKSFLDYTDTTCSKQIVTSKYICKFLESKFHIIKYFSEACFCLFFVN